MMYHRLVFKIEAHFVALTVKVMVMLMAIKDIILPTMITICDIDQLQ